MKGTTLDPRTKRSVAFYVALALAVADVHRQGLNIYNGGFLLVLAGLAGADAFLTRGAK